MKISLIYTLVSIAVFSFSALVSAQEGAPKVPGKSPPDMAPDSLNNKVIHYTYQDGASFRLLVKDDKIYWDAVAGPESFLSNLFIVSPVFDQVRDDIYYVSWRTAGGGNFVMIDVTEKKVVAHVASGTNMLFSLPGTLDCLGPESECAVPDMDKPVDVPDI